jgi:hypothetical protein
MKKIIVLFLSVLFLLPFTGRVLAQEKPKTKITTVKHKGENMLFTLTSSKPFIFGSNKYYLHVGDKSFTRNEQSKSNGRGRMTFIIPTNEFNTLKDGEAIYLTYGRPSNDDMSLEEMSKDNNTRCWSLGKFSRSLLTK